MKISLIIFYIFPPSLRKNIIESKKFFSLYDTRKINYKYKHWPLHWLLLIFYFHYIPYSRHDECDMWTQKSMIGKSICKEYNYLDNAAIMDELR